MKKWYYWLLLTLIYAFGGYVNQINGRNILGSVIQVALTIVLAIIQLICERHGEKGKEVFRFISMAMMAALVIWILMMLRN